MPLRILHAIRSVNPVGGGPVEGLKQMASVNRRQGHVIEVASLDALQDPWVKNFPLVLYPLGQAKGGYGYSGAFIPWLRSNQSRYDAIVVDGIWQYHAYAVRQALIGSRTPYFVYTHGMLDPWFKKSYPFKHLKKWLYWPWGDYRVLRDAAAVLFTCEEERRLARKSFWLYRCNEQVVNFGTAGPPTGDREECRLLFEQRWPETANKRCLLHLGRVHVKKAPDLVLNAFALQLAELPPAQSEQFHLIMAGPAEDSYGQEMKALATSLGLNGKVTWTGMITGDLKWGAYYQAEAFLLPSHQENFGIVVAEALACSRPVLISNKINIWREIAEDAAGFVEADDLPGTLQLLRRWKLLSHTERMQMGDRAQLCFRKRFHIEPSAQSFIEALERHGAKPRSAGLA